MTSGNKFAKFFKFAGLPVALFLFYVTMVSLYELFNLPSQEQILDVARSYYDQHGYWLIFVSALIEGVLLVNWYFPGSIVIVFGVSLAYPDPLKAFYLVLLITLGFLISAVINYGLGRYGWYRLLLKFGLQEPLSNMQRRLQESGLVIIFSSYIHPNLGALTATSAGILQLSFKKFLLYSVAALLCWNMLWGIVAFIFGEVLLDYLTYLIGLFLLVWVLLLSVKFKNKKE
jgi:membrane protein DedA with SNARE-associated domain